MPVLTQSGHRVPILVQFGTFASARGATRYEDLPPHVEAFVGAWITRADHRRAHRITALLATLQTAWYPRLLADMPGCVSRETGSIR